MSWFRKLIPSRIRIEGRAKRNVPEGLWTKCPVCSALLYQAEVERNYDVCPKCAHHRRQPARRRLDHFLDREPRIEIGATLKPVDMLGFEGSKKYRAHRSRKSRNRRERTTHSS